MILYHIADLDGHCSGAIAHKATGEKLVPYNYGYDVKLSGNVIMVDCSMPDMSGVHVWHDHHTIIGDARWRHIEGNRRLGVGACELTWEYYYGKPVPEYVRLLSRYDVWDLDERVLHFQYGMQQFNTDPRVFDWDNINVEKIIKEGKAVYNYVINKRYHKYEGELFGYPAVFMNAQGTNSINFDMKEDVLYVTYYFNKKWFYSLYSKNINCAELAKLMGGGGHFNVAGFSSTEFL